MNTKDKNYKEILRINRRQQEISIAQGKLGFEKLDEPYQRGWDAHWVLRDDIARSEQGEKLQVLLDDYGVSIYSDNKEFKTWSYGEIKYHYHKPYFVKIPEATYKNFYSWAQQWFVHDPSEDRYYWWYTDVKRYYKCVIPEWMLVMKKEKHWVTHYKVLDNVLTQEYDELADLESNLYGHRRWWRRGSKSAKFYQSTRNREFRNKEKRVLKKAMLDDEWDDIELPIQRKQVSWDMW